VAADVPLGSGAGAIGCNICSRAAPVMSTGAGLAGGSAGAASAPDVALVWLPALSDCDPVAVDWFAGEEEPFEEEPSAAGLPAEGLLDAGLPGESPEPEVLDDEVLEVDVPCEAPAWADRGPPVGDDASGFVVRAESLLLKTISLLACLIGAGAGLVAGASVGVCCCCCRCWELACELTWLWVVSNWAPACWVAFASFCAKI
jgi:hypothetical protein